MLNRQYEYIKMSQVESRHWSYKSLHALVLNTIKNNFVSNDISILDAGCGTGGLLSYLHDNYYKNIEGFDISLDAVKFAQENGFNIWQMDLKKYEKQKLYDLIVSNDTMYFFDKVEQKQILNSFCESLNRGGIVVLNLPSFNAFGGIHDKAVGIKKR